MAASEAHSVNKKADVSTGTGAGEAQDALNSAACLRKAQRDAPPPCPQPRPFMKQAQIKAARLRRDKRMQPGSNYLML
jgi:hypothetical protein